MAFAGLVTGWCEPRSAAQGIETVPKAVQPPTHGACGYNLRRHKRRVSPGSMTRRCCRRGASAASSLGGTVDINEHPSHFPITLQPFTPSFHWWLHKDICRLLSGLGELYLTFLSRILLVGKMHRHPQFLTVAFVSLGEQCFTRTLCKWPRTAQSLFVSVVSRIVEFYHFSVSLNEKILKPTRRMSRDYSYLFNVKKGM